MTLEALRTRGRSSTRKANLVYAFVALGFMAVLAAHITFRVPWNGTVMHSRMACAYLVAPAFLLAVLCITCMFKEVTQQKECILSAIHKTTTPAETGSSTAKHLLQGTFFLLSIACIALTAVLDKTTDPQKQMHLAIAEAVCLSLLLLVGIVSVGLVLRSAREAGQGGQVDVESGPQTCFAGSSVLLSGRARQLS